MPRYPHQTRPPKPKPLPTPKAAPEPDTLSNTSNIYIDNDVINNGCDIIIDDNNNIDRHDNISNNATTLPQPPIHHPTNNPHTTQQHDDYDDDPLDIPEVNLTTPLTTKEKNFLKIYLSGKVSRAKALALSGYKISDSNNYCLIANRILEKHVRRVDLRQILRSVGLSEIRIAKMVLQIAEDLGNSAKTRLAALELAAKMMGMTRDTDTGYQGAEIVIEAGAGLDGGDPGPDQEQQDSAPPARVAVRARMRTVTR
jgi:hypothetical protein